MKNAQISHGPKNSITAIMLFLQGALQFCSVNKLTGQLADKPTRVQLSRELNNSRTGQHVDSEFLKIMVLIYFICTLNLTISL